MLGRGQHQAVNLNKLSTVWILLWGDDMNHALHWRCLYALKWGEIVIMIKSSAYSLLQGPSGEMYCMQWCVLCTCRMLQTMLLQQYCRRCTFRCRLWQESWWATWYEEWKLGHHINTPLPSMLGPDGCCCREIMARGYCFIQSAFAALFRIANFSPFSYTILRKRTYY